MTSQEILNKVVLAMRAQGGPSLKEDDFSKTCLYRNSSGRKCAAGVLIPDDLYRPEMEMRAFGRDKDKFYEVVKALNLSGEQINLIADLQSAHDQLEIPGIPTDTAWLAEFELRARQVAMWRGLEYPA